MNKEHTITDKDKKVLSELTKDAKKHFIGHLLERSKKTLKDAPPRNKQPLL